MNSAINFLLESGVSLSLLSLIYIVFLRKETFLHLNRAFLLLSVAFSVVLPFLHFRVLEPQSVMLAEVTVTPYRNLLESVTVYSHDVSGAVVNSISSSRIIILVYILGLLCFSLRFGFRILQVGRLIQTHRIQSGKGKVKFVYLDKETTPFSFLNYVFINPGQLSDGSYREVIDHELEHIRQGHSFDVLILEVLTILQWFNPFMWILKKATRENHEFLADRAVLSTGVNAGHYKQLLLSQALGFQLEMANNFNSSLVKKRIKMISKIKSSKLANLKYIIGALTVAALVVLFACEQKETADLETVAEKSGTVQLKVEGEKIQISGDAVDMEKVSAILNAGNLRVLKDSLGNTYIWSEPAKETEVKKMTTPEEEEIFFIVEKMPEFPGGELALREYIAKAVNYPEIAQKNGIQGKVYVTFTVAKDGSVRNVKIVRGVDPSLDKEALRVISALPTWTPGIQRGQAVNVQYTVPINFALK